MAMIQNIEKGWKNLLASEFEAPYMQELQSFLKSEKQAGKTIFPAEENIFSALNLTPLDEIKIVILGQDPYHGEGQAHGLSFSVPEGVRTPPSLRNIYKEIERDLGITPPQHGFLEKWAKQGVLLLNSVLSVENGKAASHQGKGWERFTDAIITRVNESNHPVVFMLWGSYAQKKASFVDGIDKGGRHLILTAPHPSPLSAHRGFIGCSHFSQANTFLGEHGRGEIDWKISPK